MSRNMLVVLLGIWVEISVWGCYPPYPPTKISLDFDQESAALLAPHQKVDSFTRLFGKASKMP